jgi:oligopeptide/dipeptide ABC transporter ATP-binding protein
MNLPAGRIDAPPYHAPRTTAFIWYGRPSLSFGFTSYLLIAHHLATTCYMAHAVAVMYLGKIVERARTKTLFENPSHPYTKALFSAALPAHPDIVRQAIILPGEVPSPINPPGCRFHPRCSYPMPQCSEVVPKEKTLARGLQRASFNTSICFATSPRRG